MKKTNLLLAASIAALLSGCGGGGPSTPAASATESSTTESSAMSLPENISLAREDSSAAANLASVSYAAFDDTGTDYSNQTQQVWIDDGDYEALNIINGVLKIMTFTKASELANKGTYKILFDDPFDSATTKQKAYVKVTRADTKSTTPLYVHFYMPENWSGSLSRLVIARINKGKSATAPLGEFLMNMILLKDGDYSSDSLASWESTARGESDPFFETMTLKVSPDATTADQTNIQLDLINDGEDVGWYDGNTYNKSRLGANIITTGALDSGYGWLMREWGIDTNDFTYDDELFPSFDDKFIADRVGESAEGDGNSGMLSFRSQFTNTNYTYKIFNADGTKLDLGNAIAAFGFKDFSGNFGWIGTNYAGTDNPATSSDYSGKYYHDTNLSVGDVVTKFGTEDTYTVTAVDTTNKLVDLKNTSDAIVTVGSWSSTTIGGKTFYKNGDTLYPGWTGETPNTISGNDITISGTNYKVKPTLVKKSRELIDETEGSESYADLSSFVTAASDKAKVKALTDQISDLSTMPRSSGLDAFDTSILNSTYEWYRDTIKGKESDIPLRVVDGQVISTE